MNPQIRNDLFELLVASSEEVLGRQDVSLSDALIELLPPHLGNFRIDTVPIVALDGAESEPYLIVHNFDEQNITAVPVDSVALVIETCEELTLEELENHYQRIVVAKGINKTERATPPAGDVSMTTSLIVARTSALNLEQVSEEMGRLNGAINSSLWPDAVAILPAGLINYSAYIPGAEKPGDFFLPSVSTSRNSQSPTVYIQRCIRAGGVFTLPKLVSLIVSRVAIFDANSGVPNYLSYTSQFPNLGITTDTYQFNLANQLVPMTSAQRVEEQLPTDVFHIKSGNTKLGSVSFQSWQDGGVFIVRGGFPLDLFLVFLREVVGQLDSSAFQYFRNKDFQMSYVLPVTNVEFMRTLEIFQQRSSNMRIEQETSKIMVQQMAEEGTSSPCVGRLILGVFNTRDLALGDAGERDAFDKQYDNILSSFQNMRDVAKDINQLWETHKAKIDSGEIVNINGRQVSIGETIDRRIKRELESFMNLAQRILKNYMQDLTDALGKDIGFLFKKENAFNNGLEALRLTDTELSEYLREVRLWSEPLILNRNDLEHGVIAMPTVQYAFAELPVRASEPQFQGRPISDYLDEIINRVSCFVEEVTTHCLQAKMQAGLGITEVAVASRTPETPERFRLTIVPGGNPPWVLAPHQNRFEDV